MARKAEVIFVGDAQSLVRAARTGADATAKAEGRIKRSHSEIGKSAGGMAKKMVGAAVAFGGAYAAIGGVKSAVDGTTELAHATLQLHKNFGLSVHAASQWAAVARSRDIAPQQLTMGFKTLSAAVQGATAGSKTQVAQFKLLGISHKELAAHGNDLHYVLRRVSDGMAKLPAGTNRAATMAKLFGRSWQGVAPLIRGGSKAMDEQLKMADKYGVTFKGKTVKSLEDLIAAQRESKFATMGMQVALGTTLAPVITKVVTGVSRFTLGIREGTGAGGKFRDVVAPAIHLVGQAVKGAVQDIRNLVTGFQHSKTWAVALVATLAAFAAAAATIKVLTLATKAWAVAQLALDAAMDANPVGIVIVAVAALAAAFVVAYKKSEAFRNVVHTAMHAVETVVRDVGQAVKTFIHYYYVVPFEAAKSVWGALAGIAKGAFKAVISAIRGTIGAVKSAVHDVAQGAWNVLHGFVQFFYLMGKHLIQGLVNGVKAAASSVADAVGGVAKGALHKAKSILGIGSPSREFFKIGKWVGEGLSNGINAARSDVLASVSGSLLFPLDAAIAQLEAKKTKLQSTWDAIDSRAQRSTLLRAIGTARAGAASSAASGRVDSGLGWARAMVGHFAESTGQNTGPELDKLQAQFHTRAAAWCAEFATTAAMMAGANKSVRTASVATARTWAAAGSHGFEKGIHGAPRVGDLAAFGTHHIGVVESVDRKRGIIHTIEGNTSAGKVARRTHAIGEADYLRPKYPGGGAGGAVKTISGKLSIGQRRALLYNAGFRGKALDTAVAISQAEDRGGVIKATNRNANGSIDRGFMQINSVHGAMSTFDPVRNAKAAYSIFKSAGGKFTPWSTFNSGAFRGNLGNVGHGRGVGATFAGTVKGGDGGSVSDAIKALHEFDKAAARSRKMAAIDLKIGKLQQLKAFKAAVAGIRSSLSDLAGQAADVWRASQDKVIANSADAQELAGLQAKDAAEQDAKTVAQLNQDLADATASGDVKAIQDAQDAIADYKRGKREQELSDNLDAARQKADDDKTSYQAGLDAQLQALTDNLEARKTSYADWAKAVNGILSQYGLAAPTSADDQATIGAAPPATASAGGSGGWTYHPPGYRPGFAAGGPVYAGRTYRVGEVGAENFTPGVSGHITPASRSHGGGGATVIIEEAHMHGTRAAKVMGDRLAHRLKFG